jgi:hypothetical protein
VDLGKLAGFANLLIERTTRPLDWLHMPVPIARTDDGIEGARRRINAARRYIERFGVATECGMRFFPRSGIADLLSLQRAAAALTR